MAYRSGTVQANGVRLAYEEVGDPQDPAILLIMGLGAQLVHWPEPLVDGLAAGGFRVIRYDNRDAGLSTHLNQFRPTHPLIVAAAKAIGLRPKVPYKLPDLARDALGLLDSLGLARAHLVGASMGGMIAQLVAADAPDRVLSLTSIMSTSGARGLPGPPAELRRRLLAKRPEGSDRETLVRFGVELMDAIGTPGGRGDVERRALVERALDRAYNPAGVRRQLLAILASGGRADALARIRVPTLVIHGTADRLVPKEGGVDTAARVRGARLELIEGMAHDLPPKEVPRIVELICEHAKAAARAREALAA
ncbi:MAG: Beta-ketoadipate enol-lactone hydrolase [uncultured Sphingomonadaceae bacterium]|uniref:Beta-ketoadipate enol-lactone hydrolase n=1 Tax=uncultured Sphingomonadaceae bacterium TaxID=169976 RepID=A0A6J4SKY7_9SPHN|nr:MAG: Beta-ketoadipate enol-lactone hydrolase [uncultured Sphingomonadaceae bacterium]